MRLPVTSRAEVTGCLTAGSSETRSNPVPLDVNKPSPRVSSAHQMSWQPICDQPASPHPHNDRQTERTASEDALAVEQLGDLARPDDRWRYSSGFSRPVTVPFDPVHLNAAAFTSYWPVYTPAVHKHTCKVLVMARFSILAAK